MSKEIELTQGLVALIDAEHYERVKAHNWLAHWQPRENAHWAQAWVPKGDELELISLQRFILNQPPGMAVCFRNGNALDCRNANLRIATHQQASWKSRIRCTNTSGYKGVSWNNRRGKWVASIVVDAKSKYLGSFDDPIDAALAYDEAARALFGEFARPNFPRPGERSALYDLPDRNSHPLTPKEPNRPQPLGRKNTSGYKGVSWDKEKRRWVAMIKFDGRQRNLGRFDDPIEAALTYDQAARQAFGASARLNFPKPGELPARADIPLKPAA
jgi:hypothetical protein